MHTKLTLNKRPVGLVDSSTFKVIETPLKDLPSLQDGEFLVDVSYISLDPAMRRWIVDEPGYMDPVQIGEVMRAMGIGNVTESKNSNFQEGDLVSGYFGWQSHCVVSDAAKLSVSKLRDIPGISPTAFLGALGITGFAAYFGLLRVGTPKEGDMVLVSAAHGSVGSLVGQIARIKGCTVVGICGSDEKCKTLLEKFRFSTAINYKGNKVFTGDGAPTKHYTLRKAIESCFPNGIDIYFDNVGGNFLEAALFNLNYRARIVLCGSIKFYNKSGADIRGPRNYMYLIVKRARMEGILASDYEEDYPTAIEEISQWIEEGEIFFQEHIVNGLKQAPAHFNLLFSGGNKGKLIMKV